MTVQVGGNIAGVEHGQAFGSQPVDLVLERSGLGALVAQPLGIWRRRQESSHAAVRVSMASGSSSNSAKIAASSRVMPVASIRSLVAGLRVTFSAASTMARGSATRFAI